MALLDSVSDPTAELKLILQEMDQAFQDAGIDNILQVVSDFTQLMTSIKSNPELTAKGAEARMNELAGDLKTTIENPTGLLPPRLAAFQACYGNSVVSKLKGFDDESASALMDVHKMDEQIESFKKVLGETVEKAADDLKIPFENLTRLPKLLRTELQGKEKHADVANIDVDAIKTVLDAIKKHLDVGGIDGALDAMIGLKEEARVAVAAVNTAIQSIARLYSSAPTTIKAAFNVPFPGCCLTDVIYPKAMKDMLASVDSLGKFSFGPLLDVCRIASKGIKTIDAAAIRGPIQDFHNNASELVDRLEIVVETAKLVSDPLGTLADELKNMPSTDAGEEEEMESIPSMHSWFEYCMYRSPT